MPGYCKDKMMGIKKLSTNEVIKLLRKSYREGDRVRKRTLANLSSLSDEAVEKLKVLLKRGTAI